MPPVVFLALMLAHELPAEAGDAAKLERIRRALAEPPAITDTSSLPREGPVFRVTVRAPKPDRPLWDAWSAVRREELVACRAAPARRGCER
jgi:hypothetical protein